METDIYENLRGYIPFPCGCKAKILVYEGTTGKTSTQCPICGKFSVFCYCKKWLMMQSGRLRATTLADYESKVRRYIQKPLGKKLMSEVTPDDVKIALLPAAKKSESVYSSTQMLYKLIFTSAKESNIISVSPCDKIPAKGGKPPKGKEALAA